MVLYFWYFLTVVLFDAFRHKLLICPHLLYICTFWCADIWLFTSTDITKSKTIIMVACDSVNFVGSNLLSGASSLINTTPQDRYLRTQCKAKSVGSSTCLTARYLFILENNQCVEYVIRLTPRQSSSPFPSTSTWDRRQFKNGLIAWLSPTLERS